MARSVGKVAGGGFGSRATRNNLVHSERSKEKKIRKWGLVKDVTAEGQTFRSLIPIPDSRQAAGGERGRLANGQVTVSFTADYQRYL